MATIEEQIKAIQAEIDKTQKNKATEHHIGRLKAKIAKLKITREKAQAHAKASGGGKGFEVKKSGDASVALVGFPSVGKSTFDFTSNRCQIRNCRIRVYHIDLYSGSDGA